MGAIAAHVLGGASFGREGVRSAEVVGTAGVEKTFDRWLRDPANGGAPLQLSLDLTIQSTVEDVLSGGMKLMNAKGATAVLMDAKSGEIVDLGVELNVIQKSGSWFAYNGNKLGQGRDAVKQLIEDNPELMDELEKKIKEKLMTGHHEPAAEKAAAE